MTRSSADLRFMAARVIAHVRANPPTMPLLTEPVAHARPDTCQRGHREMRTRANGLRYCGACSRERQRQKRQRVQQP